MYQNYPRQGPQQPYRYPAQQYPQYYQNQQQQPYPQPYAPPRPANYPVQPGLQRVPSNQSLYQLPPQPAIPRIPSNPSIPQTLHRVPSAQSIQQPYPVNYNPRHAHSHSVPYATQSHFAPPPTAPSAIQAAQMNPNRPLPAPQRSGSLPPQPKIFPAPQPLTPPSVSTPSPPNSAKRPLPTPSKHQSIDLSRLPPANLPGPSRVPADRSPSPVKRINGIELPVRRRASPPRFSSNPPSPSKEQVSASSPKKLAEALPPLESGQQFVPLWKRHSPIPKPDSPTKPGGRPLPDAPAPPSGRSPYTVVTRKSSTGSKKGSSLHARAPARASSQPNVEEESEESTTSESEQEPPSPQYGILDLPQLKNRTPGPERAMVSSRSQPGQTTSRLPQPPAMTRVQSDAGPSTGTNSQIPAPAMSRSSTNALPQPPVMNGGTSMTLRFAAMSMENGGGSRFNGQGEWPADLPRLPQTPTSSPAKSPFFNHAVDYDDPPPRSWSRQEERAQQDWSQRHDASRQGDARQGPLPVQTRPQTRQHHSTLRQGDARQELPTAQTQPQIRQLHNALRQGDARQELPSTQTQSQIPQQHSALQQEQQPAQPRPQAWSQQHVGSSLQRAPSRWNHSPVVTPAIKIESPKPLGGRDTIADIPKISLPDDEEDDNAGPQIQISNADEPPKPTIIEVPGISFDSSPANGPPIIAMSNDGTQPSNKGKANVMKPIFRGKGLMCAGCGGNIIGKIVAAMGLRWHPDCFRCTVCDELLEHVSSYEHEGRPYCHLDYHENFAPKCYHCKTAIIEERFISLDDPALGRRTYHEQHFFCSECGDPFMDPSRSWNKGAGELSFSGDGVFADDDVGFIVYKGYPYCEACHVRLRLPKCKKCGRSIRDHMEAVEALGGKWCWQCFTCARCDQPFENPSFFQRDDKPYCQDCFSIILRNEI